MSKHWLLSGLISLVAVAGCASSGMRHGHADAEDDEKDEVKIAFADVPANVRSVIFNESKGATPATVDKEMHKGKEVYEADVRVDGVNREIVVAADGTLVHNKVDDEADEDDEKPKAK